MRMKQTVACTFPIPNDPDKGEVTIKHLSPGEVDDLQEKVAGIAMRLREGEDGRLVREGDVKQLHGDERYIVVTSCVVGWKNVRDPDGVDMACDYAGIIRACRESEIEDEEGKIITFSEFVGRCRDKLAKQVNARQEAAAKNS